MSASLVVLLPVILLGIVGLFCFVGCHFPTSGENPAFIDYANTVLGNPAVLAYWPLNDAGDSVPALDLAPNPDNGQYIDPNTAQPGTVYPWPQFTVANGPSSNVLSAAAPGEAMSGTIQFQQSGIVNGDFGIDTDSGTPTASTCVVVNGCFVNVPFASKINPPTSTPFTVEAWVQVGWSQTDKSAWRAVLDGRSFDPCGGFAILATADDTTSGVYHWSAIIGNGGMGSAGFTQLTSADPPITLTGQSTLAGATIYYLAVTFDGQKLTLFVNGVQSGAAVTTAYMANSTSPLWIGAGAPFVPMRPQSMGTVAGPLFPFQGALQDVAIYSKAMSAPDILTHYHNGNGLTS